MQKLKFLKPALSLLIITVGVALLLSLVNHITADRIVENNLREKREAIARIFPEVDVFETAEISNLPTTVTEAGTVKGSDGKTIGYYAEIAPVGFKDSINMIVGTDINGSVTEVVCLSSSETAGVGTKATTPEYLVRFTSLDSERAKTVDTITGATISSKAVKLGISEACAAVSMVKEAE
ncbi:MAG: FMN-binding protein [Clostridia bacterium]|nr:FMN-binding protein [Clostridia bacterium]